MLGVLVWHGRDGRAIAIDDLATDTRRPATGMFQDPPCPMDPVGSIKLPATTVLTEF
ncbi:hypothetical protein J2R76_006958 [Bradyrhizobium sp. USDA 4532]|nr:hypothetical protein [Bradyrhizobium sp. USDA 4545]MCP1923367.1 hypothetical protein [Bradyrhizobium sp. USDA 4532]